jgi:hypothetical protein
MGTPLDEIVSDVATAVGIADSENLIGSLAMSTPQSNAQLSQVSAWEMLEQLLLVAGLYPFTDAIGRLKAYSRDLFRASDVVLDDDRVKRVRGSKSRAPLSRLLLKWRSPTMTIVKQQDRSLASATLTAGFFQLQQRKEVWWSDDRTQRAMDTRLVIKQSANSGLIPVCSENYDANNDGEDATGGVVELDTLFYVPTLLSFYVAGKIALALVPEPVVTTGVVGQVGATEPEYGRYAEAVADVFILTLLASLGTGVYEVWGTPYDFVNPINQTEAYDPDAETQLENVETIETDFAGDEGHAQVIVRREFVFRVRAATSFGLSIVDDPRIEEGDIVELADGSRVFVTSFSRDLSPGAPAVLEIGGFPA